MKIIGSVCSEVKYSEGKSNYKISCSQYEYEVISYGKQAIKDFIFIRKGQNVEVDGNLKKEKIYPIKEKILIQKNS